MFQYSALSVFLHSPTVVMVTMLPLQMHTGICWMIEIPDDCDFSSRVCETFLQQDDFGLIFEICNILSDLDLLLNTSGTH